MNMLAVYVENADRMMTYVMADHEGIRLTFADGRNGIVPFADIPGVKELDNIASLSLPNPYEIIIRTRSGEGVEIPWDFARHYCDATYRSKVEAIGALGRKALGQRTRRAREKVGMTQDALATAAGIGRVTLVRIENGEQSPRYDTLSAIANGLGCPIQELLIDSEP